MIDLSSRDGKYVGISLSKDREIRGVTYRTILYGAICVGGLYGSEYNGIAVLDRTNMSVVLDNHSQESSGYYGPSQQQVAEFRRIREMSDQEFIQFCNSNRRSRYAI